MARRRFSAARDDAAKSLSRAAPPSRWYTEPYWLLLLTNVKRSRAPTSDLKSRWRNGSTVAASAILSDCTTSLYTLAWGTGGRLKAPPVPFGYFRAVESNNKTRACQGGKVELRRKSTIPPGPTDPPSSAQGRHGCGAAPKFVRFSEVPGLTAIQSDKKAGPS